MAQRALTDGSPSPTRPDNQEQSDDDAEPARDDIGDVCEGTIVAYAGDTALWVDAYWSESSIGREVCEGG